MSIVLDQHNKAMLLTVLRDPKIPHDERRVYNTGIIGSGVAYSLPLPTERLSFPDQYYDNQYSAAVKEFVSALNEEVIIDLVAIVDITKQIWLNRYTACYVPSTKEAIDLAVKVLNNSKPYDISDSPAISGDSGISPAAQAMATPDVSAVPSAGVSVESPAESAILTVENYIAKHVDNVAYLATNYLGKK